MTHKCMEMWDAEVKLYQSKKKKKKTSVEIEKHAIPFPFPRKPYSLNDIYREKTQTIAMPIPGLGASFLSMTVPCDVLSSEFLQNYYPTALLAELLSRTEGPLYTSIRGRGYHS